MAAGIKGTVPNHRSKQNLPTMTDRGKKKQKTNHRPGKSGTWNKFSKVRSSGTKDWQCFWGTPYSCLFNRTLISVIMWKTESRYCASSSPPMEDKVVTEWWPLRIPWHLGVSSEGRPVESGNLIRAAEQRNHGNHWSPRGKHKLLSYTRCPLCMRLAGQSPN